MMSQNAASTEALVRANGPLRGRLLADMVDAVIRADQVLPGGVLVRVWKVYIHVWLVCLVFPIAELLQLRPDITHLASHSSNGDAWGANGRHHRDPTQAT